MCVFLTVYSITGRAGAFDKIGGVGDLGGLGGFDRCHLLGGMLVCGSNPNAPPWQQAPHNHLLP